MAKVQDALEDPPSAQPWPLRLGILMALVALCAPAQAADWWWDPNGTAIGLGGAGTWNTSNAFLEHQRRWRERSLQPVEQYGPGRCLLRRHWRHRYPGRTHHRPQHHVPDQRLHAHRQYPDFGRRQSDHLGHGTAAISSLIHGTSGLTKAGTGTLTLSQQQFRRRSDPQCGRVDPLRQQQFRQRPTVNSGTLALTGINSFVGDINVNGALVASAAAALGSVGNNITISAGSLNIGTTGGSLAGPGRWRRVG